LTTEEEVKLPLPSFVMWQGDDLNHSPGAAALFESIPTDWKATAEMLDFYNGKQQWDPEHQEQRERQGRPCLVVNMLPQLYALAIAGVHPRLDSYLSGQYAEGCERLKCWIAHRNRDAQKLYNYMCSHVVEMAQLEREQKKERRIIDQDKLATTVKEAFHQNRSATAKGNGDDWLRAGEAAINFFLHSDRI